MIDSELLHRRIDEADEQTTVERALLSLLHASFEDDSINFSYHKPEDVEYSKELIDAGRFALDKGYEVRKNRDKTYSIQLRASYDEMLPEDIEGADFHAPVSGTVVLKLTLQVGPRTHTGEAQIFVIPDWRKA